MTRSIHNRTLGVARSSTFGVHVISAKRAHPVEVVQVVGKPQRARAPAGVDEDISGSPPRLIDTSRLATSPPRSERTRARLSSQLSPGPRDDIFANLPMSLIIGANGKRFQVPIKVRMTLPTRAGVAQSQHAYHAGRKQLVGGKLSRHARHMLFHDRLVGANAALVATLRRLELIRTPPLPGEVASPIGRCPRRLYRSMSKR